MNQLLDLCLTLKHPPDDEPEGVIATVEVRCDALGLQPLTLQPLRDPFTPKERLELEWYLEEYWKWPYEEFARRGQRVEQLLTDAGQRLYRAVFEQAQTVVQPWRLQPDVQRQLSIISNVPQALSLPWELLHDEQGFLALRTKNPVSIIRRLPQAELGALPSQFTPPLRVLLVTARPDDAGFVDPRGIARELLDEVQPQIEAGTIALEFLRPPTRAALRERLSQDPPIHILHFDGHGTFAETQAPADGLRLSGGAQGMLAFEKDDGSLDLAPADELAQLLQDSGVRLAVLTACQSAKGASDDLFSSVAARLIRSGVDAVVAMSASVLVVSAALYVKAFYRKLAAGEPVTLAHERARQALYDKPERHLHQRRRDEAGTAIRLKDWWLPHFYQQRAVTFVVPPSGGSGGFSRPARLVNEPLPPEGGTTNANADLPPAPRYGFTGRARELHQIERWLLGGSTVVVHGFGGTGKTAIARETADWLTRTGMYQTACFVSFEHGGDATMLLSMLGHRLGIYTGDYDPGNAKAALTILRRHVRSPGFSRNLGQMKFPPEGGTSNPILIIADNVESILPGGDAPLDAQVRAELWDVLLLLSAAGAGVLLTSRNAEFGDGRMAHSKEVKHLELRGLDKEDAYTLAVQIFKDLDIPQSRAPYPKLRDLLAQLDHHPLAIQLVLPVLGEAGMTIDRMSSEFATLLPRFTDDRETGRNRSLLASLEYSLRRLSDEQRQLLVRLAVFEGGASENNLLAITEIAESDWLRLRPALERAALLTPEQVGNFNAPFLRFHPILTPYLRTQPGAEDAVLRSRHATYCHEMARHLYHEDTHNPRSVRELVRHELHNLRRALEWLLDESVLEEATELVDSIVWFLNFFGLWRERDELRCRLEQAIAAAGKCAGEILTRAEYLRESGIGEDELARGNLRTSYACFTAICQRIEEQPVGALLGPESYEHCLTLARLGQCLLASGQCSAAETQLRRALAMIEALLAAQPNNHTYHRERGAVLTDLGNVLAIQGNYEAAQTAYETAQEIVKHLGDTRNQGVVLGQFGRLALDQRDHATAHQRHNDTLQLFQSLGEKTTEADAWDQLGRVAEARCEWAEAERYYRASLEIRERHGHAVDAAGLYNQLANVALLSGRPDEAESWYKRALNTPDLSAPKVATYIGNLAGLLLFEVRAGRMPVARLAEAHDYAEQALKIKKMLDAPSEIWNTFLILAEIAELEGDAGALRNYRRHERESFAAFAGNRWHIDQRFGEFISACALAALGDAEVRAAVAAELPKAEANGWNLISAIQRVWAGERDWQALVEDLDRVSALLVKRVLETMEEMEKR